MLDQDFFKESRKIVLDGYNIAIDETAYKSMIRKIQEGECLLLERESKRKTHWLIDDKFIAIYNKSFKSLNFLPPEAIDNYLRGGYDREEISV